MPWSLHYMSVNFVHSLVIFVLKYFNTKVTKINASQMAFESISINRVVKFC